jgi:hypothetical protein
MENWEDLDTMNEEQWPTFAQAEEKRKKEQETKKVTVWSDSGLRAAHPYFESQPKVKILARKQICFFYYLEMFGKIPKSDCK